MSHSVRRSWSSAGSLKGSSHFCNVPKKLCRHLSLVCKGDSPGDLIVYGGSRLKRTSHEPLDKMFGLGYTHGGYHSNITNFESQSGWKNEGLFSMNAKETMQALNSRLATYLDKVATLEKENQQLERKIKEWYNKHAPQQLPDFNIYFSSIKELKKEIFSATIDNAQVRLHIDNARLAGDDLQNKYSMEFSVCNSIEVDLHTLRRGLDGLTLERSDLEFQIEYLTEELVSLNKNHEEEANSLKAQLGNRVNVEVDAPPAVDLSKVLLGIRNEYESLVEQNNKDVEIWFNTKSEELNCEMVSGCEQLQLVKSEATELRHTIQTLEIDLQTQLSTTSALEGTLAETEECYSSQLSQIQDMVNSIEAELEKLRHDLKHQNHEYKILMDVKSRLEMEITTYRRLLEGEDTLIPQFPPSQHKGSHTGLKIVSITEEFEDGKFVSKHEQIHHLSAGGS
ncbi:keratin, type I cytoskeletal 17-like [Mixophyes fleayi]|uniref:keratin, type I cytoskeletal 17-like n=1 Tax=Mixophyes fleayi TaxID=3061075 RepID=UPI003F4D9491